MQTEFWGEIFVVGRQGNVTVILNLVLGEMGM
jgi:hypothetical protein